MLFIREAPILQIVALCMIADVIFGFLRAFKECQMNSSFGILGLIRKTGMLVSIVFLIILDRILGFNFIAFLPQEWLNAIGLHEVGIAEIFGIMFILYEALSILKNMVLIGVPIPRMLKEKIEAFLYQMTDEMPRKNE